MKKIILYAFLIVLLGCNNNARNHISPIAKEYIDEVISLLEQKSIKKNQIDWTAFTNKIYLHARNSKKIEDTYPCISFAISELKDNHSYFEPAKNSTKDENLNPLPILADENVPRDIGYIRIPFFIGNNETIKDYIDTITEKISQQNKTELKGWIVDLRENFGGNMWPMLVSIEPILGDGIVGYFLDNNNNYEVWKVLEGKVFLNSEIMKQNTNLIHLKNEKPNVAVLINAKTASSGEAISIAFKGRDKTKFFGTKTFGISTGCKSYTLSDNSRINLAESIFVDRNKTKYGSSIQPDVKCNDNESLQKAIDWLNKID